MLVAASAHAAELRVDARHDHARKGCTGALQVEADGVQFAGSRTKKPHKWTWKWLDVQQAILEPGRLTVLIYADNRWKLGTDREYVFLFSRDTALDGAAALLRANLGLRYVDGMARPAGALWQLETRQGRLIVSPGHVVLETGKPRGSRTWRYEDIESVSTDGPFDLTLTTFERSRVHYGSRKSFHLQLKEPLAEERYDSLWRRVESRRGLGVLNSYRPDGLE